MSRHRIEEAVDPGIEGKRSLPSPVICSRTRQSANYLTLSAEDEWLRAHRQTIHEKISRGLAQLDRGEGIAGDEARAALQKRKTAFLEQDPQTP
jgi:hypothetical protein